MNKGFDLFNFSENETDEKILERWEKIGFLEEIDGEVEKLGLAKVYQGIAEYLVKDFEEDYPESNNVLVDDYVESGIVFLPLARKIYLLNNNFFKNVTIRDFIKEVYRLNIKLNKLLKSSEEINKEFENKLNIDFQKFILITYILVCENLEGYDERISF